jgi:hypothetical protein
MTSYFLSPHVHSCLSDQLLVFLDLRADQYFSLDRDSSAVIAPLLAGGPGDATARIRCADALEMLLDQGLITTDRQAGRSLAQRCMPRPVEQWGAELQMSLADLPGRDMVKFTRAAICAAGKLRLLSIERTVESIRRRRAKHRSEGGDERLRQLTAAYVALRPLFPKRHACLFDSLALLEFLALHRLFPVWVFGVKTSPFGAHCWVQEGDAVLADTVEQVSAFTPIMAV